jgi:hypothetical protein
MIRVRLPDGTIAEFPDGMPDDEVAQAVADYEAAQEAQEGPDASEASLLAPDALDAPSGLPDDPVAPLWPGIVPSMPPASWRTSGVQPFAADNECSANEFRYRWSQPAPDENTAQDPGYYNFRPVRSRRG